MPKTDYYGDPGDAAEQPQNPQPSQDKDESDAQTALIPKSLLAGKKFDVGDEVCLEIVAMHEDEVEVRYSTKPSGETDSSDDEVPEEPVPSPSRMGQYME